jgi:tetraacyldisaccharide 4'-kinase
MREPRFWWRAPGFASALLSPLAAVYGGVAAARMRGTGARAGVPVICVGNFTLGGTGKTPAAIALAQMLEAAGERPFCLTRGYGGSEAGPRRIDAHKDAAADVGDEALLLARAATTILARDRVAGAALARAQGAGLIVMDDGLQNPSLAKDLTIAVVDARRGLGNGMVFPAGPLRAPLTVQFERCDALLIVGDGSGAERVLARAQQRALPVWRATLEADARAVADIKRPVLAFAGIGDPEKFFASAAAAGLQVVETRSFPDHHRFTADEAGDLVMRAEELGAALLTTEKDRARMRGDPALSALAGRAHVLPVAMRFADEEAVRRAVGKLRRGLSSPSL